VRVAIVSDVHGNLTALEAVIEALHRDAPDLTIHGGDLALSGAQPAEVVDRVREFGWPGIVGNTDELLWRPEELDAQLSRAPALAPLLHVLFDEFAPATRERLGDERVAWLKTLPPEWSGDGVRLVHASPGNLWRAPMPDARDDELRSVYGGTAISVYCHIHRPFVRDLGDVMVANSGSAGAPYDADPRASYLLIDDGLPLVKRVVYDTDRECGALEASGYPRASWIAGIRRTGVYVPPDRRLTTGTDRA
jgi:predicted phosphodiesterase